MLPSPDTDKQPNPVESCIVEVGGRPTEARKRVLAILLAAERTLTHTEIEQTARDQGVRIDRVTLYRSLDWLVAKGLAHKIAGPDRAWRFNAVPGEGRGHAHFHCTVCGQVFCLNELNPAFAVALPKGFRFERAELSIEGTCPCCTSR